MYGITSNSCSIKTVSTNLPSNQLAKSRHDRNCAGRQGVTIRAFIEPSATIGHISCYDNVIISSGVPVAELRPSR